MTAKTTDTLAKRTRTGTFRGSTLSRGFLAVFLGLSFGLALCLASPCLADNEPDPLFDDLFDEEFDDGAFEYPDPLESTNRAIFSFNRQSDKWLLDPLTKGYRFVVPKPARSALSRMFLNLGSPKIIVNDFLQLEWKDMAVTTTRFVINSTVGIVGLFDVAKRIGLSGHESDFGQTLALAGTPSGPYLIFPFLGPSNVRDATGSFTDVFFNPFVYFVAPLNFLIYSGSSGLSERDRYTMDVATRTFASEIRRLGLGELQVAPWLTSRDTGWPKDMEGGHHHMGTTRMSDSPTRGVVDGDCRTHAVDNLYVAGSSVFPTSSYVNPTPTLLALAVRLADHLAWKFN